MNCNAFDFCKRFGITKDTEELEFLGEAARIWVLRGGLANAFAIYDALTVLRPDYPLGYLGMSEVYALNGQFAAALAAAERAVRTHKNDRFTMAYGFVYKALAHYGLGQRAAAADAWRLAQEIAPSTATANLVTVWQQVLAVHDNFGT